MTNVFKDYNNKSIVPSYNYIANIKTPQELGMGPTGDAKTLIYDINGLQNYIDMLVSSNSNASKTNKPLGNKYFLYTGGKCYDTISKSDKDRYVYINNVPMTNNKEISGSFNNTYKDTKGLLPGVISNLNKINPFSLMDAFMIGEKPTCSKITLETIDVNNNSKLETQYIATVDISNMDACEFVNKTNPITNKKCVENFNVMNNNNINSNLIIENEDPFFPDDPIIQFYFMSLAGICIYIMYKYMKK